MSGGIDKLIVLSSSVKEPLHRLAREAGVRRGAYSHVIDLRPELPVILHCDGIYDGRHKIEFVGVARLGRHRTLKILKKVIGDLSAARICRIDLCVDLFGFSVWDLARICYLGRTQNFYLYHTRKGDTVYLQRSGIKTIQFYDKARVLRAAHSPWARMLRPDHELTRVEVQLKGAGVPFKKPRHLWRYADIDLLAGLNFRRLVSSANHKKPLRAMAAAYLADEIEQFGLHAVVKRFSPSHRAYVEKVFLEEIKSNQVPDIRRLMRKAIEDWLEDRIRWPRFEAMSDSK